MRRHPRLDLYLVTDRLMASGPGLEHVVAEALAGGVTCVQLRDDATPEDALIAQARGLGAILARTGVPLIVNNRLAVARAAAAGGAHVGQHDASPQAARAAVGPDGIVGLSITEPRQLAVVDLRIVDYLGVGPVFATGTKPDAAPAMGLAGLAACRQLTRLPIVAIGGIDASNAAQVMATGVDGIAVVSAINAAVEPRAAARRLAAIVAEVPPRSERRGEHRS